MQIRRWRDDCKGAEKHRREKHVGRRSLPRLFQDRVRGRVTLALCDRIVQKNGRNNTCPQNSTCVSDCRPVRITGLDHHPDAYLLRTHVSRAARIEPIPPSGQVCASESFAALAAAHDEKGFACDYAGQVPMSKGCGTLRLFDLQRAAQCKALSKIGAWSQMT